MALFLAAIKIDSVSLLRFLFLSYVPISPYEILLVCRLKYPYSCFSNYCCSVDCCVVCVVSNFFFYISSNRRSEVSEQSSILASPLPPSYLNALFIFTNPSARAGYDTRSVFKQSLTDLNAEFSFS